MSNTTLVRDPTAPAPAVLAAMSADTEVDDDENAADIDDEDDIAPPRNERWAAHPGFGSPEWWAH